VKPLLSLNARLSRVLPTKLKRHRHATIKDVAREAGGSASSVSRHLAGQNVRNAQRINEAIERLGYQPNASARGLKSGRTHCIAVLLPDILNPYNAAVVKGVHEIARDDGFSVSVAFTDGMPELEMRALAQLRGRIDGLILGSASETGTSPDWIADLGVPAVCLEFEPRDNQFDTVLVDNVGGARQAVAYLIKLRHKRIAIISGSLDTTPGRERHQGFLEALEAGAVEFTESRVRFTDFTTEGGYQATLSLLAGHPPPTAIVTANNLVSIGALNAFKTLGFNVPQDVSFVGFDDLEFWRLSSPQPTVVSRPMLEQGAIAVRLLLNRIRGLDTPPQRIVLQTQLVIRESCRALAE